jgi:hypothetical protein
MKNKKSRNKKKLNQDKIFEQTRWNKAKVLEVGSGGGVRAKYFY